jgi:hypothetical protein
MSRCFSDTLVSARSHSIQIHCMLSQEGSICRVLTDVDIVQRKAMVFWLQSQKSKEWRVLMM